MNGYIKAREQADYGSLERSTACVMLGCNESLPRVERESAYWGLHTIEERIFPTDFARGMETPRGSLLLSNGKSALVLVDTPGMLARSSYRVLNACFSTSHSYFVGTLRCVKIQWRFVEWSVRKNEVAVSWIARISSHLSKTWYSKYATILDWWSVRTESGNDPDMDPALYTASLI